ncbi:MAG: YbaN family protein [Butyrivibrio sp.]|nr:YbaN family protein [Butyrivibrio sp.]
MIKLIFFILSIVFFIIGFIGLMLPVIPQIPFFVIGVVFLMAGSKRFERFMKNTNIYKNHLEKYVKKSHFLSKLLEEPES